MIVLLIAAISVLCGPASASAHDLAVSYRQAPAGPLASTSQQPVFDDGLDAEVRGGGLTASPPRSGQAAGYFGDDFGRRVTAMGMRFSFNGPPNQEASVGLIPWTRAFTSEPPSSSPAHLSITPVSWGVEVWRNGHFRALYSEFYGGLHSARQVLRAHLNIRSGTPVTAKWVAVGKTLKVKLPNGETHSLRDPALRSIKADWPTPEIYYGGPHAPQATIYSWWADDR